MTIASPVLVTGGTGFIGRTLIDHLLKLDLQVASFALPGEAVPDHWSDQVKVIRGNITEKSDVTAAMQGIKTVFHLAAVVGMGAYDKHKTITVEGSRNIFEAALESKCKVVLAASIVVYGDQIQTQICDDSMPHGKHQGAYSWAKMAQEKLALDYQKKGMALTVIRPANVYGLGSGPWVETPFALMQAGALPLTGDQNNNAGLVHVKNLVDALVLAAQNEKALGRIYTVCDGLDVSWSQYFKDLATIKGIEQLPEVDRDEMIKAARQYEDPETLHIAEGMPVLPLEFINLIGYSNRFDCNRIREELGWEPSFTYEQALDEIRDGQE